MTQPLDLYYAANLHKPHTRTHLRLRLLLILLLLLLSCNNPLVQAQLSLPGLGHSPLSSTSLVWFLSLVLAFDARVELALRASARQIVHLKQ